MFVQVIHGRVSDPDALRAAMDRWAADIRPTAIGFLGATAGVTEDGRFINLARFASAEDARRNSERPEQDAWWRETSRLFDGEVTFHDSEDVSADLVGDPDSAGFVQVMQGRTKDPQRAKELMAEGDSSSWSEFRPDMLGSVNVDHGDGSWTAAMYFTSEAEARQGERKEPPPQIQAQMAEMDALADGPVEFFDLKEPWLLTAP
jgi:hypothetical protein